MSKKIRLLLSVIAASSASSVFSQPENEPSTDSKQTRFLPLEHVIVSIPAHQKDARTAMPVSVLDGDELRQRASASLGETLNQTPGMSSASFGPGVGQPVIRGQQGPRVQVLQNSLPSLDVSSNSADHAVSVEPMLADSIEILRGPATLLYGGGAIGGIVNVLDGRIPNKPVSSPQGGLELRHSSVDDGRTAVFRGDAGYGAWQFHVDGVYRDWGEPDIPGLAINPANVQDVDESSDGFLANASGRSRQFAAGAARHFEGGYWGLSYSELRRDYGIPAGVHHHGDEHEHEDDEASDHDHEEAAHEEEEGGIDLNVIQRRWDVAGDRHGEGFWELLRWRLAYSEYEHVEVEADGAEGTRFQRDALAGRAELSHRELGNWHGVLGVQWLDSDFSALGEEAFVPKTHQQNLGLFWLEDYHGGGWQIELGLRGEFDRLDPRQGGLSKRHTESVSSSLGGTYDVNEVLSLGMSLARSSRAPTAEELFSNVLNDEGSYIVHGATGSIEVGDQDLSREVTNSADVSLDLDSQRWQGSVALFYKDFENYIYLDRDESGDDELMFYRQQNAEFKGLEYEFSYLLWQGRGDLRVTLFGDRVSAELADGDAIPRLPPQRDGLRLAWQTDQLTAGLSWLRAADQRRAGRRESATEGYHRLDATLSWSLDRGGNRYIWSLSGRNLGDELIRSSSSVIRDYAPEPGRNLVLSLRIDFNAQ
jgi:iron complex outermembrane recepter protein